MRIYYNYLIEYTGRVAKNCVINAPISIMEISRDQIDFIGYLNKLKQKLTTEEAIHFKNSTSNIFDNFLFFLAEQI